MLSGLMNTLRVLARPCPNGPPRRELTDGRAVGPFLSIRYFAIAFWIAVTVPSARYSATFLPHSTVLARSAISTPLMFAFSAATRCLWRTEADGVMDPATSRRVPRESLPRFANPKSPNPKSQTLTPFACFDSVRLFLANAFDQTSASRNVIQGSTTRRRRSDARFKALSARGFAKLVLNVKPVSSFPSLRETKIPRCSPLSPSCHRRSPSDNTAPCKRFAKHSSS